MSDPINDLVGDIEKNQCFYCSSIPVRVQLIYCFLWPEEAAVYVCLEGGCNEAGVGLLSLTSDRPQDAPRWLRLGKCLTERVVNPLTRFPEEVVEQSYLKVLKTCVDTVHYNMSVTSESSVTWRPNRKVKWLNSISAVLAWTRTGVQRHDLVVDRAVLG